MTQTHADYPPPVVKLMALGEVTPYRAWFDYSTLGISAEHETDLLALMMNYDYHNSFDQIEIWIPMHAWRALAQLHSINMALPYCELLINLEDDDWIRDDAAIVVPMLGPVALAAWSQFLDRCESANSTIVAHSVLKGIIELAKKYLEARRYVTDDLTRRLTRYADNDEGYNGWLVKGLVELRARKTVPLMAAAYAENKVDELIEAWSDVLEAFHLSPDFRPNEFVL